MYGREDWQKKNVLS